MSEKTNRQVLRSQNMLRSALIDLLQEKSIQKITITEITERANLARSTFYTHFETKEELLHCCIDETLRGFFEEIRHAGTFGDQENFGIHFWAIFFSQWKERQELVELFAVEEIHDFIIQRLRIHHQNLYRDTLSELAPQLNPTLAGYFIEYLSYASFAVLKRWIETGLKQSPEAIARLMSDLSKPTVSLQAVEELSDLIIEV